MDKWGSWRHSHLEFSVRYWATAGMPRSRRY